MSTASIVSVHLDPISLEVAWSDGGRTRYPWIWLRDNAHDADTLHPVTQQRQLYTAGLPAVLVGQAASVTDESVTVTWTDADQAESVLPVAFLARYRDPRPAGLALDVGVDVELEHWDRDRITANVPTVPYADVISSDDGVRDWLATTTRFGFCLATGTPATADATEALLRRVGYVRETIFGGMWEFTADLTKADTAYTNLELRPHTDGTYSHDAPGVQLLHCLQFDGTGGESTMVDAFAAAERLRSEHPQHFATLATVAVPGQYIGDGSHLVAARPVLRLDRAGRLVQVSFNNYDRAPFLLPEAEMIAFYDALRAFDSIANDPAMQWRHVLQPGEAMLFDNWRVLHGRFAYTGVRRMCGGYVNREDVESRLRQLLPSHR
ncbi:MAG: Trimethyllysine dioxygenase [Ilumatobacteraceae bacterium]|nr:Trimethyllysine dioxygenase [Ilumatobacteraceae bacterium]